jgi:membrane-bound serine protease (ClpP class)
MQLKMILMPTAQRPNGAGRRAFHLHPGTWVPIFAAMALVVILLVLGVVLLLLETILPGMIAGIAGTGCLLAGIVVAYRELGVSAGHYVLLGVLAGLVGGFALWAKYFPGSRFARVFVSKGEVGNVGAEQPQLLGQTGVALTHLRPSGIATLNGRRVDVVTEGPFIERGTPVKVIDIEGLRVVVRVNGPAPAVAVSNPSKS